MGPQERRERSRFYDQFVPEDARDPLIDALEETWSATARLCEELPPDAWEQLTDCPGWTVRDHMSHMIGTELSLLGVAAPAPPDPMPDYVRNPIGQANEAWIEARRTTPGAEVLAEFVSVTTRRLEELSSFPPERWQEVGWSPVGQAPYREFMTIRVFDCWVHGQDIRWALGRPGDRDGRGEKIALTRVSQGMPFVVGRQVRPPDGTTVVFAVGGGPTLPIGVEDGRAKVLEATPAPPTVRIALSAEHFVRLGCGRQSPDEVLAAGQVGLEGDAALGEAVVRAMNFMI